MSELESFEGLKNLELGKEVGWPEVLPRIPFSEVLGTNCLMNAECSIDISLISYHLTNYKFPKQFDIGGFSCH